MKTDKKAGKLSLFLASRRGKKILNVAYSWGAAVVIVGALFKLLHWSFGDQMLFVGMMTEFLVFFISGFEQPEETYKWEQVFPELNAGLEGRSPQDMEAACREFRALLSFTPRSRSPRGFTRRSTLPRGA